MSLGLDRRDGAGALLAAEADLPGLLGSVAGVLDVSPGTRRRSPPPSARSPTRSPWPASVTPLPALELLRSNESGRAGLLVGGGPPGGRPVAAGRRCRTAARWAVDLVAAPEALRPALARALDRVAVVEISLPQSISSPPGPECGR